MTTSASLALATQSATLELFSADLSRLYPSLRAHALKLCRNLSQAEDLVHDTFIRAIRFESSFVRGTNLKAWAHQILRSIFITGCRRRTREIKALAKLTGDPCAWTRPENVPVMQSLSRGAKAALLSLPENYRDVVILVDLQGQSYQETADILGIPTGTVMSRLFRGRRLLRAQFPADHAASRSGSEPVARPEARAQPATVVRRRSKKGAPPVELAIPALAEPSMCRRSCESIPKSATMKELQRSAAA